MSHEVKPFTVKKVNKMPLILKKKIIIQKDLLPSICNVKVINSNMYKKDVLYEAKTGGFLGGDLSEISIVNHMFLVNNACRTVATCKLSSGEIIVKTSDQITQLIGQNNYNNLFTSLCSVLSRDLKIRGIYSLLTGPKPTRVASCQTDDNFIGVIYETGDTINQKKMRRRTKRACFTPYVVPDNPAPKKLKRLVITPDNFEKILNTPNSTEGSNDGESILPDLGPCFDDDSNNSCGRLSALSIQTPPDIYLNPMRILENVDKVTRKAPETSPVSPKDTECNLNKSVSECNESIVKKENINEELRKMPVEQRIKLLLQQGLNDYYNCLQQDNCGHLPIHVAVLNNDVDLLKRQCLVLKMRGMSVDIQADTLTPLRMSLYQENVQLTSILLQHNADALTSDVYSKNCFHVAAEMATEHLQSLVNHYQLNARRILEEDETLWKEEYTKKTNEELSKILFSYINKIFDCHGYTPLMLASKFGRYENVKLLLESYPEGINIKMPSSGNTPLFLAVGSACMDSAERGDKSKVVDHFKRTIEILVENGADHNATNFSGATISELISEYNIAEISMLVANKLTYRNFSEGKLPANTEKCDAFMIVKDNDGNLLKLDKYKNPPKKPTNKESNESKNITILKSETITNEKYHKIPVDTRNNSDNPDLIKNMPIAQNLLNKPLLLKRVNKRKSKIEVTVESIDDNTNSND